MRNYHILVLSQDDYTDRNRAPAILDMLGEERAFPITPNNNVNVPQGVVLVCKPPLEGGTDKGFTVGRWETIGINVLGSFAVEQFDSKQTWDQVRSIIAKSGTADTRLGKTGGSGEQRV